VAKTAKWGASVFVVLSKYCLGDQMTWVGHVGHITERENTYRIFVGKPKGKRQFGKTRPSCKDCVNVDLK